MTFDDICAKLQKLESDLLACFQRNKTIFSVLVVPLLIVCVIKFRDIIIDFLIGDSKKIVSNASKQDAKIEAVQNADETKANQEVAAAQAIAKEEKTETVDVNWYKNQ